MSSVENFLNRSYPRFASTTTTSTASNYCSNCAYEIYAKIDIIFYLSSSIAMQYHQRRPSLWGHDSFTPGFRFSPQKFQTLFSIFIPKNLWWPFYSHRPQISNSHLFSNFSTLSRLQHIPPMLRENYYFSTPTFTKSPLFSENSRVFTCFTYISFPPALTMMHLRITQCTYWTPMNTILYLDVL